MLQPLPKSQWNETAAAHLLNRAAFGGTPAEIQQLAAFSHEGAVDKLVEYTRLADTAIPPAWAKPDPERAWKIKDLKNLSAEEREKRLREYRRESRAQVLEMRCQWIERMATGPRPLQEKMTLFWHGHFATNIQKVKDPYLMWLQIETFRQHATGPWEKLLTAAGKDPAMLIWLDGAQNRSGKPNENFAREVMELFTLGEGHYTEEDIREGARAFTGWNLAPGRQEFQYRPVLHDGGEKTFMGKSGRWHGEDIIRIILDQPQSNRFITSKLWEFFAGPPPDQALGDALARAFAGSGQTFAPLLKTMFLSQEFYEPQVVRNQIKSPAQWLAGTIRLLERPMPPAMVCNAMMSDLGQELLAPPNVKGWDGGIAWITTANLLHRYNHAAALLEGGKGKRPEGMLRGLAAIEGFSVNKASLMQRSLDVGLTRTPPAEVMKLFTEGDLSDSSRFLAALEKRFLQGTLKPERAQVLRSYLAQQENLAEPVVREAIRLLFATPDYQLA
jgi:uncharacterized protein (DUF1800 family)